MAVKKKKAARPKSAVKPKAKAKTASKAKAKPKAKPAAKSKPKASPAPKRAAKPMTEAEMMAQWQAAMTPSDGHARLMPMVGTWHATTTFRMAPDAPETVSEGSSVHRLVLGGRYLEQIYKGTSMGMPFEGMGFTGFDNVRRKYIGVWMDTFGTGLMHSISTGNPTDQRIDFTCEAIEPSGDKRIFEAIVRINGHEKHSYEMWTKGDKGMYRVMLVEYERG
jgi:hypothetical protein